MTLLIAFLVFGGLCLWAILDARRINRRRDQGPLTTYYGTTERRLAKRDEDDARLALRTQNNIHAEPK